MYLTTRLFKNPEEYPEFQAKSLCIVRNGETLREVLYPQAEMTNLLKFDAVRFFIESTHERYNDLF